MNYDQLSITPKSPKSFSSAIETTILVITRWNDYESRKFLRNTILGSAKLHHITNTKLLFVFGIPKNATEYERANIQTEQNQCNDMIIPGKF